MPEIYTITSGLSYNNMPESALTLLIFIVCLGLFTCVCFTVCA